MPQPIFHLYLAERPAVLDAARIWDNDVRNAFLHGAVAPDVGFFPGGERQLSHLVHHARTGDMCRALLAGAENAVERAFAYGWLTHVLADAFLHPIINEWCEQKLGAGASADDLLRLHVQLELGMDVLHVTTVRREGVPSFQSTFDEASIAFLARAYRRRHLTRQPRLPCASVDRQLLPLDSVSAGRSSISVPLAPSGCCANRRMAV